LFDEICIIVIDITNKGGGSKSKVGVSGDSAGGQLSSAVAHDVPGVAFQVNMQHLYVYFN